MKTDEQTPGAAPTVKSERWTIIAVIVAILIGIFQAVLAGAEMRDLSRQQATASQIVERQLENLRATDWTRIDESATDATAGEIEPAGEKDSQGFVCRKTVTTIRPDLKQVTLTVSWRASSGRSYSQSGSTFLAKDGRFVAN